MRLRITTLIFLMSLLAAAAVVAEDAKFSFVVPSVVVYDVPFSVQLLVDTDGVAFIDYDLAVGSNNDEAAFGSALIRGDSFQYVSALSGVQESGAYFRARTETNGNSFSPVDPEALLTFTDVRFVGTQEGSSQFVLRAAPQQTITPASAAVMFTVSSVNSEAITPQFSFCGDGVVGYVDSNSNGVRDSEAVEACDDSNTNAGDGCSATCDYIDLGFECTNTAFGNRNSVCTPLSRADFFLDKMTALLKDRVCYPSATHPQLIYDWFCDESTSNNVPGAAKTISAVGDALLTYLTSTG